MRSLRVIVGLALASVFTAGFGAGCSSDKSGTNTGGSAGTAGAQAGMSSTKGGAANASGGHANGGSSATGGGGTSGGTLATGGATAGNGVCGAAKGQLFDASYPWNQPVDSAALDSESSMIIDYLSQNHTASARFRIDGPSDEANNSYGIVVLTADASTPRESFNQTDDFYSPDCDPAKVPVPAGGAIEGESGYACENDGDCHLLVVDGAACRLYEMWRANRTSASSFDGGCLAVWDLKAPYQETLRGDCCTSADAAGLPIAAHLFSADEIAAGEILHAIRFILPNEHMRKDVYVRPATHSTGATSGPASAPPYGSRLRLKATFDETKLKPAARVVARALKRYGMILSDGGNITFTAMNDRFTTAKWADVDFGPSDLTSLRWTDFEVVELGERHTFDNSCDCRRTPLQN